MLPQTPDLPFPPRDSPQHAVSPRMTSPHAFASPSGPLDEEDLPGKRAILLPGKMNRSSFGAQQNTPFLRCTSSKLPDHDDTG
ncbi:hypothetical protein [Laribacter hongkongensis]|uniref:hypothetical protein n=1 Tax=Laribacter hongkongensis TaxID=168471 RepID=UPI001EFCF66D|nr:hypothetical protein [Laribacter hongkongensis]MCG9031448.1 hypothetical protein [Laribacter hongkongensis]MCG9091668.1 hypothetical protein [Laribacter hongkongensis]